MRRQKCRARGAPQHKPTRSKALPGRRKPSGAHSSGSPLPARTPQTAPECQALSKKLRALKKISSYLQKLPQAALSAPPAKRQKKCRKGAPARRFRQKSAAPKPGMEPATPTRWSKAASRRCRGRRGLRPSPRLLCGLKSWRAGRAGCGPSRPSSRRGSPQS